jgi:uncharacterized repeat protein (TIGR03803 family)
VDCAWQETVLYRFAGSDGRYPSFGALAMDQDGNLYGTTQEGGAFGYGEVYELSNSASGWTETTLYSFTGGADGALPYSGVTFDAEGNLYGTADQGGMDGYGTVFELTPSGKGWTFDLLHSFTGRSDGQNPFGGLVFDSSSHLIGTTSILGSQGTVFEMTFVQGKWTFDTIAYFKGSATGKMAIDAEGNLYGQLFGGGGHGVGAVFKLTHSGNSWDYMILHQFRENQGADPFGDVLMANGILYGGTNYGGSHQSGVAWELVP